MSDLSPTRGDGFEPNAVQPPPRGLLPADGSVPDRYAIKDDDKGRRIACVEAPNIAVRIERGFSVSATAAHKYAEYSIFLDGAAQAEPFLDVKRKIYNLDHHEGCVRAFTLATCEQAMVVVLKGLDLEEGDWSVYGNEPDLDTVMAAWVLLNHARLAEDDDLRLRVMPLLRVQGVIDAHGLELIELCGLPQQLQDEMKTIIDLLRRDEIELKKAGEWQSTDLLEYTASVLRAIDNVLYSPRDFDDLRDVEECARFPVASNRIGVICRSDLGVYELEEYLKKLHKDRIGLLALQKDPTTYTLRLVDSFLPLSLEPLYDRLNQLEPNLSASQRWGGSADIGGSPRGIGTALSAHQLARIGEWVFRPVSIRRRLLALASAIGLALAAVNAALLIAFLGLPSKPYLGTLSAAGSQTQLLFGLSLLVLALLLLVPPIRSGQRSQSGLRAPLSVRWLILIPAVLLAAVGRGGWGPPPPPSDAAGWGGLLIGAIAAETLFRGAMYGKLMDLFRVVRPAGAWSFSVPNVVSAVLYAAVVVSLFFVPSSGASSEVTIWELSTIAAAALVMGLSCGLARERSGSLLPPIALHVGSVALVSVGALLVI